MDLSAYKRVFFPQNLILVGASEHPEKFGGMYLYAQNEFGFKGRIFPVNRKGGTVQGIPSYKTIGDIPVEGDLAVLAVPAPAVLESVEQCIDNGVKGIQILSAGFKEADAEGKRLENEIVSLTEQAGVKLIGPNCFGIYSPNAGLTLLPGADFPQAPGKVGFFSQSGGGACDVVYSAFGRGVKFSLVVSYGNAAGINAEEMLEYFAQDGETAVVGGYLEGVQDGQRFLKALKACSRKKPVILLKSGLTEQGRRGAAGHTGSMAGTRETWEAAIRSSGVIPAHNMRDLAECLMAFNCLEGFKGNNVGMMAGGGARVVEGLDAASEFNFIAPELTTESAEQLKKLLPMAGANASNPVDLANPNLIPKIINPIMEHLAANDNIDFLFMYQMLFYSLNAQRRLRLKMGDKAPNLEAYREITEKALEIRKTTGKPLAVVLVDIASAANHFEMEHGRLKAREHYTNNHIPCFDTGYQAFSVLRRVQDYYNWRDGVEA